MRINLPRIRSLLQWSVILISAALLCATLTFLVVESRWAPVPPPRSPQQAFLGGSIGTELIPLPVLEVLPDLFPGRFPRQSTTNGSWVKKYGFTPSDWENRLLTGQKPSRRESPANTGLPLGFSVSYLRPLSAQPSPVPFVGLTCAACHSTLIRTSAGDAGIVVLGTGNASLDLLAFFANLKAAVVQRDPNSDPPEFILSLENVVAKQRQAGRALGFFERQVVGAWIDTARQSVQSDFTRNDEPRVDSDLHNSRQNRAGPLRSNPFQVLIRGFFDRPGLLDDQYDLGMGFVKFATVFEQGGKEWAQFDGTVRKLHSRSAFAAVAAGATIESLSHPEVIHNIMAATEYVKTLASPRWEVIFPSAPIDLVKATRGLVVYREHCSTCHGYRDLGGSGWQAETTHAKPDRLGQVVELKEIKTDRERVSFAHQERLPQALRDYFGHLPNGLREGLPEGHPFAVIYDERSPAGNDVRAAAGYLNSPLPGAFLRAPYLHNASVMTLRELINLDQRRKVFYRGNNFYDTAAVGLASQQEANPDCQWLYDTTLRGNSNEGHDYPWPYSDKLSPERRAELEDLLEYLKTL